MKERSFRLRINNLEKINRNFNGMSSVDENKCRCETLIQKL
jgi:hypothetical protein